MVQGSAAANAYREAGNRSDLYKKLYPKIGPKLSIVKKLGLSDKTPDKRVLEIIKDMDVTKLDKIWKEVYAKYTCDIREQYRYCLHSVETYEYTAQIKVNASSGCKGMCLPADEKSTFEVDIPTPADQTYLAEQFLRTRLSIQPFSEEELLAFEANPPEGIEPVEIANPDFDESLPVDAVTNPETIVVAFDRNNIRYEWVNLPGIRFVDSVGLHSDTTCIQSYTYHNALLEYNEFLPLGSKELYNKLIGQDDGIESDAVFPDSDVIYRTKMRTGAQTPKKVPEELSMYIPLMFEHNSSSASKLNLGVIKERTLRFTGTLAKGRHMARATYMCGTRNVVCIGHPRVCIEDFTLIGSYGKYLDNVVDGINSRRTWKLYFRQWVNQINTLSDLDNSDIEIRAKSVVEAFLVAVRPASYEDDFELWQYFQPVEQICSPTPIIVDDKLVPGDNRNCLAIGPSITKKPLCVVKKIGILYGDTELEAIEDPEVYTDLAKWKMASGPSRDVIRINTGVHYLKVNDKYPRKKFSNLGNFAGLDRSILKVEFKDGLCDNENILDQPYQVVTMASTLNSFMNVGQVIVKEFSR